MASVARVNWSKDNLDPRPMAIGRDPVRRVHHVYGILGLKVFNIGDLLTEITENRL